jgi:hypothetical protein
LRFLSPSGSPQGRDAIPHRHAHTNDNREEVSRRILEGETEEDDRRVLAEIRQEMLDGGEQWRFNSLKKKLAAEKAGG